MRRNIKVLPLLLLFLMLLACAGATNTTPINVAVTSYETAGIALAQAYSAEKALFKAGTITAQQDSDFQLGVYTKAVNCYKDIGVTAKALLSAKDDASKATLQAKFDLLSKDLPVLVADVLKFLDDVKK